MAKSSTISTIVTLVTVAAVAVIGLIIFNKISGSELFQSKEEKQREKTLEEREDAGFFTKIARFLFGQDDQLNKAFEEGITTKNDVDTNTNKAQDEAKRQQAQNDKDEQARRNAEEKQREKQEDFPTQTQPRFSKVTSKSGATISRPKQISSKTLTATLTTKAGGTRNVTASPALIARLQKNLLRG